MDQSDLVAEVRAASRELVRRWGAHAPGVAGTDLPASAAHALIEINKADGLTARDLSNLLRLEKSTISRLVRGLVNRGELREHPSAMDGRAKILHLTQKGRRTLGVIETTAAQQVRSALQRLDQKAQRRILAGLSDYARALAPTDQNPPCPKPVFEIRSGYVDGLVGTMAQIFATRVQPRFSFGRAFECRVARDMAEFMLRAETPENGTWSAHQNGRIIGGISIDGEHLGEGRAHLRWFGMAESAEGQGIGKSLLREAIGFSDDWGFSEIALWTVKGLDAARVLYEREGFVLAEEFTGDQWGASVTEQKFVRRRPGS